MKNLLFFAAIITIMLNVSCAESIDASKIESEVKTVLIKQAEDWNNKDIDAYMKGYWQSEELTFVSGGNVRKGWQTVSDSYKTRYTPDQMGILTFSDIKVFPVSEDHAYVSGGWDLEREPDNPGGRYTLILRKFDNGWKVIYDHTSSRQN